MGSEGAPRQSALFSLLGGFDTRVPCYAGGIDLDLSVEALLSEIAGTPTAPCGLRRSNRPITHNVAGAPDYESGGQEFESLRARHQINDLRLLGDFEQRMCPRCVRNRDEGRLALATESPATFPSRSPLSASGQPQKVPNRFQKMPSGWCSSSSRRPDDSAEQRPG